MNNTNASTSADPVDTVRRLGPDLARRAAQHDRDGTFVSDNWAALKGERLFSAGIPRELGGGGATHAQLCAVVKEMALFCPSTALSFSMHTHLVSAAVWRHLHGQPAEALLRKVAEGELALVSTGASDWLTSTGVAKPVPGGFQVSAKKRFASGCPGGDLALTSAPCDHPTEGSIVMHFALPLTAPGVRMESDWDTLGMRGTGSNTLVLDEVFVPDAAISVKRPRGAWHPSFAVISTIACPIFISAYVGAAETAARVACASVSEPSRASDPSTQRAVGEMHNALFTAQVAYERMIANARNYDFVPEPARANVAFMGKTVVANAVRAVVDKAVQVSGGSAFFKKSPIEQLWRDVQAVQFHPLPEAQQLVMTGKLALGVAA
jgi:alkylation response protein AidB-like acyl-CoA dehydrogenase